MEKRSYDPSLFTSFHRYIDAVGVGSLRQIPITWHEVNDRDRGVSLTGSPATLRDRM